MAICLAGRDTGAAIADAIRGATIAVPAHFDVEVYGALRSLDRQRKLAPGALDRIVPLLASRPPRSSALTTLPVPKRPPLTAEMGADHIYVNADTKARVE